MKGSDIMWNRRWEKFEDDLIKKWRDVPENLKKAKEYENDIN